MNKNYFIVTRTTKDKKMTTGHEEILKDYVEAGRARGMTDEQLASLCGFEGFIKARVSFLDSCLDNKENSIKTLLGFVK